jgi:cell division protein FtsL
MRKMSSILFQIFLCLTTLTVCLIRFIERKNELTELGFSIPRLKQEIKAIQEENAQLEYQIQAFESPERLMELAMRQEYSHLKHPLDKEILVLKEASKVQFFSPQEEKEGLLLGAK